GRGGELGSSEPRTHGSSLPGPAGRRRGAPVGTASMPASASTSAVCSPRRGGPRGTAPGVGAGLVQGPGDTTGGVFSGRSASTAPSRVGKASNGQSEGGPVLRGRSTRCSYE